MGQPMDLEMLPMLFSEYMRQVSLSPAIESMAENPIGSDRLRLNRLLLEALFPKLILPSEAARRADGEGVLKVKGIAQRLENREVPVLVASVAGGNRQLLASEEIRRALCLYYKPLIPNKESALHRTTNFQIQIFIPRTDEELERKDKG